MAYDCEAMTRKVLTRFKVTGTGQTFGPSAAFSGKTVIVTLFLLFTASFIGLSFSGV
jgi:hypothetical protein